VTSTRPSPGSSGPTAAGPTDSPIRIALSGAAPDAIALDGETAWVLAGEGGLLMQVDLAARREVGATVVGFGPTHLALPFPGTAAVGRFDDTTTGAYCLLVDLGSGDLRRVTTGELGGLVGGEAGTVWALEKADRAVHIDAISGKVMASIAVEVGKNVHTEIQWGAGSVWVGSDGLPVVRIDDGGATERTTIPVASGIPFAFEGGLVWGAGPTEVWAIDPTTNGISRRIPLARVSEILALDVDGDDAWLAVRRPGHVGAVLRMDLSSGAVLGEYAVSLPAAVRLGAGHAWVASYLSNELLGFPR
jgi:hypothetical protein